MRKLFLSLALLLSATLGALAQQPPMPQANVQQDAFYIIEDFSKLLTGHSNPYDDESGAAQDVLNLRSNEQYRSLSKRAALNTLGTCGHSAAVSGLHRYYKSDGNKYTVTTSGSVLDYMDDNGNCTDLRSNLSSGKKWSFITYNDFEIGVNGFDTPFKWDGSLTTTADTVGARTAGDLVTDLGAPFANIFTGSNLSASKWYQYKIAYYDGSTYQYSDNRTNPILLGTIHKGIQLTNIPLGPAGTTQRLIYRTTGQNSRSDVIDDDTFYLLNTISDNTTTTFDDNVADGTISADNPPTWATVSGGTNVTPPNGIFIFIQKDYIWIANDPSGVKYGKSTVYFSQVNNPDYWVSSTNFFLIRPDDGDEIQGLTSYLGNLTIPKTNSWSKIYTDSASPTSWQISQPFSFIGVVAPYSIQATPIGVIYLGRYGLYRFDGQQSVLISDVTTNDIQDINPVNYNDMAGIYYNNEYRLSYTSTATGSGTNDRVLLFDVTRNAYSKDTQNINTWTIFGSGDDFGALYSGSSLSDGDILAHATQPSALVYRYLTDLTAGTFSGTFASGTQGDPQLTLGWSDTWLTAPGIWSGQGSRTWQTQGSPGTWLSPIVQINANALLKLYWNEQLGSSGDVTFAIRSGSTAIGITGDTFSSEFSNPNGSDIGAVTGDTFIQLRATLSTSDLAESPIVYLQNDYLIRLLYSQSGQVAETTIPGLWEGGYMPMTPAQYPKLIKEIDIYYEGTEGTLNFQINNLKGDAVTNFSIDLSKPRLSTPSYYGYGNQKVYRWLMPIAAGTSTNPLYGDKFAMTISDTGNQPWIIQRIIFRYDVLPYKPYTTSSN